MCYKKTSPADDWFVVAEYGRGQVAACSKCCSTSAHRDREIWAWSVTANAWRPALAGYSSASAEQACYDSPSLSSKAPSSKVPCWLLSTSLRNSCQFHQFAEAPLGPVHFLSPDQQSGIHRLIICGIQLLTPNNVDGTWRRICVPDIQSVSVLELSLIHIWRCRRRG